MRRPPASRRRIRPTLAAAVGCGILGGSLVGLGALGFDKVEVAAAPCAEPPAAPVATPAATPVPEATPVDDEVGSDDLVEGEPVPDELVVRSASLWVPTGAAAPRGEGTTVTPEIGPLKPTPGAPCGPQDDPDVVVLPGPGDDDEADDDRPTPTPVPAELPDDGDDDRDTDEAEEDDEGEEEDDVRPTPAPVATPKPIPRPVVIPPVVTPNPVLPAPSTTTRGFSTTGPPRTPTPGRTGTITRPEVIARAVSWVTQGVPYSQSRWWTDVNGSYRQDCSGYVAMVWRADQRINYWTGNLGTISDRIPSSTMRPGDILLLPGKHTVIFLGWANHQKTKFHLFEEYRTGYPARFVRNASLSYYLSRGYGAYEYDGIRDAAVTGVRVPAATTRSIPTPTPVLATRSSAEPDRPRTDTVTLLSAQAAGSATTSAPTALGWSLQQAVAGLPATDWTPGVAEDYTPESEGFELAGVDLGDEFDMEPAVDDLVAAQAAVDRAEEQRVAAGTRNAALTLTENRTSGGVYVLAAGLGLLFIALPLGATSRRAWAAASASVPPLPPVP